MSESLMSYTPRLSDFPKYLSTKLRIGSNETVEVFARNDGISDAGHDGGTRAYCDFGR